MPFFLDFFIEPLSNPGGVRGAPPRFAGGARGGGQPSPTDPTETNLVSKILVFYILVFKTAFYKPPSESDHWKPTNDESGV